jgi:hypothetical protein
MLLRKPMWKLAAFLKGHPMNLFIDVVGKS